VAAEAILEKAKNRAVVGSVLRKIYTEQMLLLVRMQLRNHVDTQLLKRFKR